MEKEVYIVNVKGTSEESPRDFNVDAEDWIEYWEKVKGRKAPTSCKNKLCNKKITLNNKLVGAHVYICSLTIPLKNNSVYFIEGTKMFIAPICQSCNLSDIKYEFSDLVLGTDGFMQIDKEYLVPHPDNKE